MHHFQDIRGRYRYNAKLTNMCWFGVGGEAEVLFIPVDLEDLCHFLASTQLNAPITILGIGSNILIRDGGIKGTVIRLGRGFNYIKSEDTIVTAGAAALDFYVAQYCMESGISGLEFLSGIPGTIGGAVSMNAGAYGADVNSVILEATAINYEGKIKIFQKEELRYSYRQHGIGNNWIFLEAKFTGQRKDKKDILHAMSQIQINRSSSQPIKAKTGGSTFKNPNNLSAWKLIDEAGCRTLKIGGAEVSQLHCNFFLNNGTATATDLEDLIYAVQDRVRQHSGIILEPEIKIIGERL